MDWVRLDNRKFLYSNATYQFHDFKDYGESDGTLKLIGRTWEKDFKNEPNDLLGDYNGDIVSIKSIFNKDRLKKYPGYDESEAFTNLIIRLYKI